MRENIEKNIEELRSRIVGMSYCGFLIEKVKISLQGAIAYGYREDDREFGVVFLDLWLDGDVTFHHARVFKIQGEALLYYEGAEWS